MTTYNEETKQPVIGFDMGGNIKEKKKKLRKTMTFWTKIIVDAHTVNIYM